MLMVQKRRRACCFYQNHESPGWRLPYNILGTGPQEEHLFQTFQHDGGDSEHEDQMRHVASALGLIRTNTVANTAGVTVNAWFIALRG
ncbi:hypothetical protein CU097_015642 [Rhizopus azygosporus]|uniref:Uncharacterized protein n=1 Tax=Rhizopus azygosporus TaxID=86630 RepID=A0A367KH02_RHIAZ|nr:hypothetical protein CU097_015642 [Rhizopus azygosporus]